MSPKKSIAQRLRQGAVPDTIKKSIASFITPKTPTRTLDKVLAFAYLRLTSNEPGAGWVYMRVRPGIEIEVFRRTGQNGHFRFNIHLSKRYALSGGNIEREAMRTDILPLTETSVLQILYVIRSILNDFTMTFMSDINEYHPVVHDKVRIATMLRAIDVTRPNPSTQKTLDFFRVLRS
jgi:hypothetical protein